MRFAVFLSVAAVSTLVVACDDAPLLPVPPAAVPAPSRPAAVNDTFQAMESQSMQYLPRQQEVAGWRLEEDPLVFPNTHLEKHLASDALHFRSYEVVDLTVGNYRRVGAPGFASVEIFRFPDFIKAFGAYSTRRKAVTNFLDVGNESFIGPHAIHVWKGSFYVRITGGGSGQQLGDALKQLASAVVEGMPEAPGKPAVLAFFPENFRVINSETFDAGVVFGQPFLTNAFLASFVVDGQPIEGLILPANDKQTADRILNRYKNFFLSSGRELDPIVNLGEGNFTAEEKNYGRVVAFRLDRFFIAFNGFGDKQKLVDLAIATDQKILATIGKQLRTADKVRAEQADQQTNGPAPTVPPWQGTSSQ